MTSTVDIPHRPKHISPLPPSISLSSPSTASPPSSSDSRAAAETVWDSPVFARSPPSSPPTTPPSDDDENYWGDKNGQSEPSPSIRPKKRSKSSYPVQPSSIRSWRNPDSHARSGKSPSLSQRTSNGHNTRLSPALDPLPLDKGEKLPTRYFSSADSGESDADNLYKETAFREKDNPFDIDVQQDGLPSTPIDQDTVMLDLNLSKQESTTSGAEKSKPLIRRRRHDRTRYRKPPVPGGWESEIDDQGHSTECSVKDPLDGSPENGRSTSSTLNQTPSKQPSTKKNLSKSNKKEISPKTRSPTNPEFSPYEEVPIKVNDVLHRIIGRIDAQQASSGRKSSKKGAKEIDKDYPWTNSSGIEPPAAYRFGHIYMFETPQHPGFIKIGMTTQPVSKRMKQWRYQCKMEIKIIEQPLDKPFYSIDIVEKIIHTELWAQRRKFKCKCGVEHKLRLKMADPKEAPKNESEYYTTHGEWFEISHEDAFKVATAWREWVAPDSRWLSRSMFVLRPYGRDRQLQGYWINRYRDLPSAMKRKDPLIWEKWRQPPSLLEVFLELSDSSAKYLEDNYHTSSGLLNSVQDFVHAALSRLQFVISSMAALVRMLVVPYIFWLFSDRGSRVAFGIGGVVIYFVMKWLLSRRYGWC